MPRRLDARSLTPSFALAEIETLSFDDVFLWTNSFDDLWINDTIRPSLERYLAADAGDRASRLALAAVMLKGGQVNEAESLLVPLPATDVDALVLRIRIALSGNRLDRARAPRRRPIGTPGPGPFACPVLGSLE